MSLLKLPEVRADFRIGAAQFDVRPDALEKWAPEVKAAANGDTTISMYEAIGDNWDGGGVTAKRIGAALRSIGAKDITVNINSPGGDFFEGVAIYNLLRSHQAKVTVNVIGLAASAASVIAMAGDEIRMGEGSFLMIHNAWAVAIGNRHDMKEAAQLLEPFDAEMAKLYAARTGMSVEVVGAMMDKETWINSERAIDDGFAQGVIERDSITRDTSASGNKRALAMMETAMAKAGYSRSARRDAFQSLFTGTPSAAGKPAMPCAGDDIAVLQSLISTIQE